MVRELLMLELACHVVGRITNKTYMTLSKLVGEVEFANQMKCIILHVIEKQVIKMSIILL